MKNGEVCNHTVIIVDPDTSLEVAAKLMREQHAGSLVVVDNLERRVSVGMITDRDIVVEVLAAGLDYRSVKVGEITADALVTAREEDDSLDTLSVMGQRGVRRVPVLTAAGSLAGIVALDDLLGIVVEELDRIVRSIGKEQYRESARRR